nr:hypothetical protein [Rhodococcus sp. BS-15]
MIETGIARVHDAALGLPQQNHLRKSPRVFSDDGRGVVGRIVVDDNDLVNAIALNEQCIQAFAHVSRLVERRHNNGKSIHNANP